MIEYKKSMTGSKTPMKINSCGLVVLAVAILLLCWWNAAPSFSYADQGGEEEPSDSQQKEVLVLEGEAEEEENQQKEVLVLEGDCYIKGMLGGSMEDGTWIDVDYDGNVVLTVMTGTHITAQMLPSVVEATIASVNPEILYIEWMDCRIDWNLSGLDGMTDRAGIFFIEGQWGEGEYEVTGGALDMETWKPKCKVQVVDDVVSLPEAIYYHKKELNAGASRNVYVNSGKITVSFREDVPFDAVFQLHIADKATGLAVDVQPGIDYYISAEDGSLGLIRFMNFFQDGKQYDIYLEMTANGKLCRSNTMVLDVTLPDGSETDGGGEGGNGNQGGDKDDGSSVIPRGGGGRDTQDTETKKEFTQRDLDTLLKANAQSANITLDGVAVAIPARILEEWNKGTAKIAIECKVEADNAFHITISRDKKNVGKLSGPMTIRVPLDGENSLVKTGKKSQLSTDLIVTNQGEIINTAYYDEGKSAVVISTDRTGKFVLERRTPLSFADTRRHWSKDAVDFCSVRGIVTGYGDGTLKPDKKIFAGELGALLERSLPGGDADTLRDLSQLGNEPVTRLDAAVFLYEAQKETFKKKEAPKAFKDVSGLDKGSREAIAAVQQAGIMNGNADGSFAPARQLTRGEAICLAVNLIKQN